MEPKNASLAMAFATVLFWYARLWAFDRKKIYMKV